MIAAILHNRRGVGAEIEEKYVLLAKERIQKAINGTLKTRPMNKPVYDPKESGNKLTEPPWRERNAEGNPSAQLPLF